MTDDPRRTMRVRAAALLAAMMMVLAASGTVSARMQPVSDLNVKAAFLLNVAKFVRWPEATGPLRIGIVGDDALAAVLSQVAAGRSIDGRRVEVGIIAAGDNAVRCDLLYIGGTSDQDAAALLAHAQGAVLSIGHTPRFLRDGGIMRIFIEGDRLRFQVNRGRAAQAGLQLSSQLLSLAAKE